MHIERRRSRSHDRAEALRLFLEASRARLGVRALTVATREGALVAGAGPDVLGVAALGARVDAGSEVDAGSVATWRTHAGGASVVITSWGRALSAELVDGARRILGD